MGMSITVNDSLESVLKSTTRIGEVLIFKASGIPIFARIYSHHGAQTSLELKTGFVSALIQFSKVYGEDIELYDVGFKDSRLFIFYFDDNILMIFAYPSKKMTFRSFRDYINTIAQRIIDAFRNIYPNVDAKEMVTIQLEDSDTLINLNNQFGELVDNIIFESTFDHLLQEAAEAGVSIETIDEWIERSVVQYDSFQGSSVDFDSNKVKKILDLITNAPEIKNGASNGA